MKTLWYKKPALAWKDGLPVGNGRLGAMVYGEAGHEIIQLNEESVWSSAYKKRNNQAARKAIPRIRRLLREERVEEAQELVLQTMTGVPAEQAWFQSAGELHIDYFTEQTRGLSGSKTGSQESFKNPALYRRELDLETAIVTTSFSEENTMPSTQDFSDNSKGSSISYKREVFVCGGLDVLMIHITASTPKSIYFRANFEVGNGGMKTASKKHSLGDDTIVMQQEAGVPFAALCMASASGGSVTTRGEYLVVEGADEVTLIVDVETAYEKAHYRNKKGQSSVAPSRYAFWAESRALEKICFASSAISYADIRSNHISEYSSVFNRMNLSLTGEGGSDAEEKVSTDELLKKFPGSSATAELYWSWCRYLFISSGGKAGRLPAAGCGLWNDGSNAGERNRYDLKGGLELAYLGACMTGLSFMEKPLFNFMARAYKNGVNTAHEMYGVDGYVMHTSLDLWGDTAPAGKNLTESVSPMGAARLACMVRDYYEYTMNKKFLKKNFYLLKRACDFYTEYMVPSLDGKYLVINPSVCPDSCYSLSNGERAAVAAGCDVDNRILEKLISDTIKSAEDLGVSPKNREIAKYKALKAKLEGVVAGTEQGKKILRKWPFKCEKVLGGEYAPSLYALYPGKTVDLEESSEFAELARNTVETSFVGKDERSLFAESMYLNYMVTLKDKALAGESLKSLISASSANMISCREGFDVSANFGGMLGMTRMVVQSEVVGETVEISLLPSLPADWKNGEVTGVVLKGNLRLDMAWKDGTIVKANLYTKNGSRFLENITVEYNDHKYDARLVDGRIDLLNVLPSTI